MYTTVVPRWVPTHHNTGDCGRGEGEGLADPNLKNYEEVIVTT
jgi:hypothetical protein